MPSPDLLAAALDSLPTAVTSVRPDGTIEYVNRSAAANLSGTAETLVGTSLFDYFSDRAAASARARLRQTVSRRSIQHFEAVVTLPDGRERCYISDYCPTFDADGEVCRIQIVSRDVTPPDAGAQWNVIADDLSMTRSRMRAILENAPLIVTVYDLDMTVRYVNQVIEGVRIEDVVGHDPRHWLPGESAEIFTAAFEDCVAHARVSDCEVRGASGRAWLTRLAPLVHGNEVVQVLSVTLDVTEQRRLQGEVLRKHKLESLGTMAQGIAHDFNNLLTAIMTHTGLVRRALNAGVDPSPSLDEVDAAARRAADLCEQMLVYAGRDHTDSTTAELNTVIEEIAPLTRAAISAKIELVYDLAPCALPARCGRAQLGQIVLNLINNAADAIGEARARGRIHVSTEQVTLSAPPVDFLPAPPEPGEYVQLRVADDGPGVDPEDRHRIFDPFYSTKPTGHGLGLSVVLGILTAHRAAISVDAAESGGTVMTVLIPVNPTGITPRADTDDELAHTPGHGVVLVVDDEPAIRRSAQLLLGAAGYEVLEAADGEAALEQLRRHGPAIRAVILDVSMPGRDGHSTLAAIRAEHQGLPVLMSSGRPIVLDAADPRTGFLPKPYTPDTLLAAIARSLEDAART